MVVTVFHRVAFHKFISEAEESPKMFFGEEKKKIREMKEKNDFFLGYSLNFCEQNCAPECVFFQ